MDGDLLNIECNYQGTVEGSLFTLQNLPVEGCI